MKSTLTTPIGRNSILWQLILLLLLMTIGSIGGVPRPAAAQLLPGDSLVVDASAGTAGGGALFRINPATGTRALLSDFGTGVNQGENPEDVAVEASGQILVSDPDVGTNSRGALFRVDPVSGARTVVSDFGTGGNQGINPLGVAVVPAPVLVVDEGAGTDGRGALFSVDPITGGRTLLSDFGMGLNLGVNPTGVTVEASRQILVIDEDARPNLFGTLFRVDPVSGGPHGGQ